MEHSLSYDKVVQICMARDVQREVHEAVHTVSGAFLEQETRLLA